MKPYRTIVAVTATALLVAMNVGVAHADDVTGETRGGTVEALVALNPGASAQELRDEADRLAAELGSTPHEVLEQQLAEAQESAAAAGAAGQVVGRASSGGGTVALGKADRKGDIFVSPASTLFVQHGHTGIFYTPSTIVEAPGAGKNSRSASVDGIKVGKGAVKQHVSTTQANRDKAANYAYNSMRGKPYNANFVSNRTVPASSYNCSQLVWGAYKHTTGIDLDSNGGAGVYPYNIKDSSKTVTYKTL
ncbi:YiiX/YebB-like N1pC/P60 family cysteine hydrolase [Gryllotalpicola reticulitermitis]|uniref:YiiX/YebB-like N1pC/P60 family cysteine hydrolase n=1 Tax=Gryllotalpicola reticulitermitis TaxID=1184153 RepID=A0ABV8Q2T1_9MICO